MEKKEETREPDGPFKDARVIHTFPWSRGALTSVAFIGKDKVAASNKAGEILIWNLPVPDSKTGDPVRRLAGHTNEINRIIVTPDGKTLISASCDHTVRCWDAQSDQGEPGTAIINGIERASVVQLNAKPAEVPEPIEVNVVVQGPTRELTGHQEWVHGLAVAADGKTVVTGDDHGIVMVWDLPEGRQRRQWKVVNWVRALDISPDGKIVATAEHFPQLGDKGAIKPSVRFWDIATGEMTADLGEALKAGISVVRFSPDGEWLVACQGNIDREGPSGKVFLLDPATGQMCRELTPGHLRGVTDVAYHPDGKHLFTAGRDQLVRIWRLEDGQHVRDLGQSNDLGDWISSISISPDGSLLAAADMKGQVVVYALNS